METAVILRRFLDDPISATTVQRFTFMLLGMCFLAAIAPVADRAQLLCAMAGFNGVFAAGLALMRGEPIGAPFLTRWDEAAAFLAIHAGLGALT
jgi:hypothetical protein